MNVNINAIQWRWYPASKFCTASLGQYYLWVDFDGPVAFITLYKDFERVVETIPLPAFIANSLPDFGPGLMLDWLAEQGIG